MILINRYVKIRYDFKVMAAIGAEYVVCTILLWNAKQTVWLLSCVIFIVVWLIFNWDMLGKILHDLVKRRMVYK